MSTGFLRACVVMLALGAMTPALTHGQFPVNPFDNCCQTCSQPQPQCHCVRFKPVVETCYRPQSVMTWRDECHTAYRCQARYERVPVVTYQTRVRYEKVPYTVRRRVPQCTTTMVPFRRVRYVPEHFSATPTPTFPQAYQRRIPRRVYHRPLAEPESVFHGTPVADHYVNDNYSDDYGDWTTISSRREYKRSWPQFIDDDYDSARDDYRASRTRRPFQNYGYQRKPFVRAPSAALVWQTPGPRY